MGKPRGRNERERISQSFRIWLHRLVRRFCERLHKSSPSAPPHKGNSKSGSTYGSDEATSNMSVMYPPRQECEKTRSRGRVCEYREEGKRNRREGRRAPTRLGANRVQREPVDSLG